MKTRRLDSEARSYLAQSNFSLNSLSISDLSILHPSHHHEHPAH